MAGTDDQSLLQFVRARGAISTDDAMGILAVSRATAQRRLRVLASKGMLARAGAGRGAHYVAATLTWEQPLRGLEEDRFWALVRPALAELGLAERELATVGYTFTEMVNNTIEHSHGERVTVHVVPGAGDLTIEVSDDGIGAFHSVRQAQGLEADVEAVFVLEKGRFTTSPERHSGEGIFFSSKACGRFLLKSGKLAWLIDNVAEDTAIDILQEHHTGTSVTMTFTPGKVADLAAVFRHWTDPETLAFDRTKTTVRLARFGVELLSRSEARRVTTGLEKFRHVTVDFAGVDLVGQGFCDEVFRVYASGHPAVVLLPVGMNESVAFMVQRARRSGN